MRLSLLLLAFLAAPASAQYVANQGNFSAGDGSVTLVEANSSEQLFDGSLGSILQSATLIDDTLYLVANSANRIDVVDATSNQRTDQITGGFSSPRYLTPMGFEFEKAYVSNQVYSGGSSFVLPLDLTTNTTGAPIPVDGLPEAIAIPDDGDKAYVALGTFGPGNGGVDSVAVISTGTDALLRYIDIGCFARFVVAPQFSDRVIAFCTDTDEAVVIETQSDTVVQRLAFGEDIGDPFGIGQDVGPGTFLIATRRRLPNTGTFFVITSSGVAEVSFDQTGLTARTIPIPNADTRPISAVALSPFGGLLLGRPNPDAPFSADGTVTLHSDADGSLIATYPAGIYPVHVALQERIPVATDGAPATSALAVALDGPNPTAGPTALVLTLRQPETVRVAVLDVTGRTVATTEAVLGAGPQRVALDLGALPAGTYLARVAAGAERGALVLSVAR